MDKAGTNLLAVERRALDLHKEATENLDACELDHSHPVRRQEWMTQTMTGVAFAMAQGGRGLDAAAALAIAEQQHAEWRVAQLRPFAKRGIDFPPGRETTAACEAHSAKAETSRRIVIRAILKILSADKSGRFRHARGAKAGKINVNKLAKFYVEQDTTNAPVGIRSVRDIIKKAVSDKRLE